MHGRVASKNNMTQALNWPYLDANRNFHSKTRWLSPNFAEIDSFTPRPSVDWEAAMAWPTRILLICLITVRPGSTRSTFSKTELDSERRGKCELILNCDSDEAIIKTIFFLLLVLFNIIKFRNDPCNVTTSTSSDYDEQGVCFTSHECSRRGGQNRGSCAAGFGTCCFCKSLKLYI